MFPHLTPHRIYIEGFGEVSIYFGYGVLVMTALLLGFLIGYDREKKMKAAGIKTNMLICIGSTLYTAVSILIQSSHNDGFSDPARIAAQIVSGIGFLGAGAIIQSRGSVKGLTTAATIWVVAAVGVTIGAGYPLVATFFTLTVLGVLKLLDPLYKLLEPVREFQNYHLEVLTLGSAKRQVKDIVLSETKSINEMYEEVLDKKNDMRLLNLYISIHPRRINAMKREIKDIIKVEKVNFHVTDYAGRDNDDN